MLDLTAFELQEIVLMVKSRKAWATYLGLERKEAEALWNTNGLKTPVEYVRGLGILEILERIAEEGSVKRAAKYFGVSEAFLKTKITTRGNMLTAPSDAVDAVKRYKSITLATRFLNKPSEVAKLSEAQVRKLCKEGGYEPAQLVDYTHSNHEVGKGRRAELDWRDLRGTHIVRDLNLETGSQADYDFDDKILSRVNVKSSKMHRFKAMTRGKQAFWKFSSQGKDKADVLVCMCYGASEELVGWTYRLPNEIGMNSFQITADELEKDNRFTRI